MRDWIDRVSPTSSTSARWREVWQLALAEHMTAAESLEMRVIASFESMTRSRGRFAAVAPTAATMTSLATTPNARIRISPSMSPIVRSAFAYTQQGAAQNGRAAMNARTDTATCKSINEAPVSYCRQRGSVCAAPRRHCELCLHLSTEQIERFER